MATAASPVKSLGSGAGQAAGDDTRLNPRKGKADGVRFKKSGYVKEAAKQGKSPQAVVKVISQARGFRVVKLLEYVARTDQENPLTMEDENGLQYDGQEGVQAIYNDWRQDFERAKPNQKRPPRHVTHMIFSGDCAQTPLNARAVQSAVAELMHEQLGKAGFRYVMVLHQDTDHPHVHVMVNNYNVDKDKPKLRINPPELLAMRQQLAQKMRDRGLEQYATNKIDRLQVLERIALGMDNLQEAGKWYEAAMLKASKKEAQDMPTAEATEKMVELANRLAEQHGIEAPNTNDFETVRKFLDQNAKNQLGLRSQQSPADSAEDKLRAFDALAKRKAMSRLVAGLKEDVKATTLPFSPARKEKMAKLRELDKQLIQPTAPDYNRLTQELALKFGKDVERIRANLREFMAKAAEGLEKKQYGLQHAAMEKIITRQLEAVKSARRELLAEPGLSLLKAYALGHQLKQYERELARIKRTHAVGAQDGLQVATADEMAAARAAMFGLAKIDKAAGKLEAMGAWHEPTPGRDRPSTFDAFAKRETMAKIVTHLSDAMDGLPNGRQADSPLVKRLAALRAGIEAPAPDYAGLVKSIERQVQATGQRLEFDARKAAHSTTSEQERADILAKMQKAVGARSHALQRARRELAESALSADKRASLEAPLKHMGRVLAKAERHLEQPATLRQVLVGLHVPSRDSKAPSLASAAEKPKKSLWSSAKSLSKFGAEFSIEYGMSSLGAVGAAVVTAKNTYELADWLNTSRDYPSTSPTARPDTQAFNSAPRATAKDKTFSNPTTTWSHDYGRAANLNFNPAGFGRPGAYLQPTHQEYVGERAAQSLAGVRTLSSSGMVQDRPPLTVHVPNHALAHVDAQGAADAGLRRPHDGVGAVSGGAGAALTRIDPADLNQEQLAGLLRAAHERLLAAGAWDDSAPFHSAHREAVEGRPRLRRTVELDAFAKRLSMIEEVDKLKAVIDGPRRVDFTPAMRSDLAALRELRTSLQDSPARDLPGAVSRLLEKVTRDQLRIEEMRDKRPASAVAVLEQRRTAERLAKANMRSINEATRIVQAQKNVPPMTRAALTKNLQTAAKAMGLYAGKGMKL